MCTGRRLPAHTRPLCENSADGEELYRKCESYVEFVEIGQKNKFPNESYYQAPQVSGTLIQGYRRQSGTWQLVRWWFWGIQPEKMHKACYVTCYFP